VEAAASRAARKGRGDGEAKAFAAPAADLAPGDAVRVHPSGTKGTVVELRDRRAVVEVGTVRMELPVEDLEKAGSGAPGADARRGGWSGPALAQVRTEVDLRGLRVDEMEVELLRALDEAIREDLSELRVIHGKGTGALRQRVGELLSGDPRVVGYRMGAPREGGAGVTVVALR
jgi:DNA mismatch repair protein MutS2